MKTIPELQRDVRRLRAAVESSADLVSTWLDGMACDAGNPDGGSAASCEHCQLRDFLDQLHAVLDATMPPEDQIDWYRGVD